VIPFDFDQKLGYYSVGNQVFKSKIDACIAGTQQNTHPEWHFNDQIWKNTNWTIEPQLNILEIYKARARQIREKYDYVIIQYSAGSDSQTVVNAFLDAGCFIDEIVTVWNRDRRSPIANPGVTDPRNIDAEFELTTRPGIDQIISRSPKTKITYRNISDSVVDTFNNFDGEEWLLGTTEHLNPQYMIRKSASIEKDALVQLDRGLRTVVVSGIDKPRVCIKDGRYSVFFLDMLVNNGFTVFNRNEYTNLDYELFFWSPDMPEIIVKQAHLAKRWFEAQPQFKPLLVWPNSDANKKAFYEIVIKGVVYPEWDLGTFQCVKPKEVVFCEWDSWFFDQHRNTAVYNSWIKGIEYVQKNVDKKYLNYSLDGSFQGFVGMINGHFYIE
jgi:hypothetical protein